MKKKICYVSLLPVYLPILLVLLMIAVGWSRTVTVISANAPISERTTVIIDAGHGGVDGGATSCSGVLESNINLEIALKLEAIMNLLGMKTVMIRTTDESVYTYGETIAEKKVSDIKERVRIVNNTEMAVLVSIHQNYFSESKYNGAQVFYAPTDGSMELAKQLQAAFIATLNPGSRRQCKKADKIYLLQHIQPPGVLIECGFISNPQEENLLRSHDYQNKLCSVIAGTCSNYLFQNKDAPS